VDSLSAVPVEEAAEDFRPAPPKGPAPRHAPAKPEMAEELLEELPAEEVTDRPRPRRGRGREEDEDRGDHDRRGDIKPAGQWATRIFVLLVGLAGAGLAAMLAMVWASHLEIINEPEAARLFRDPMFSGPQQKELLKNVETAGNATTVLFICAGVGLLGALLAMFRFGLIGGLLMLGSVVAPAVFHPGTLMFTGLIALAGLLALFIRSHRSAVAAAERSAARGMRPSSGVLGYVGLAILGLFVVGFGGLVFVTTLGLWGAGTVALKLEVSKLKSAKALVDRGKIPPKDKEKDGPPKDGGKGKGGKD
jgi:hypothetical protein